MKLGIINSAFGQAGVDTATGLEHIARIGFDCVDIFTEAMTISPEEKRTIARTCEKENLPIVSLPVVATGLIDFNDPVRDFHVARCKQFLDLAAEFKPRISCWSWASTCGSAKLSHPMINGAGRSQTCRILGDYADQKNVDIALELEPFRLSLLNNVDEMVRFIDECAHPGYGPISTSATWSSPTAAPILVQRLKDKAIHVHISDCDGKVHGDLPPGRGIVKFTPYLQAIKELGIGRRRSPSNWNILLIPRASWNGWKRLTGKPID